MYTVNLVSNRDSGLDPSDDLEALLDEQVELGWEESPERAQRSILTITDETGRIAATIMWLDPAEGQEQPDLLIILATGETRRYTYVEAEPVYSSRRVA